MQRIFPLALILFLLSCNTTGKKGEPATTPGNVADSSKTNSQLAIAALDSVRNKFEAPSQTFIVPNNKTSEIKGSKGTVIKVIPGDLKTKSGKPVSSPIKVELKELTNKQSLVTSDAQTVCNGQVLVSGGAYYIGMTSGDEELELQQGKTISVMLPKMTSADMSLFYGQRDSMGNMTWVKASDVFKSAVHPAAADTTKTVSNNTQKSDALDKILDYTETGKSDSLAETPEQRKQRIENKKTYTTEAMMYEAMNLNSLGGINCDRFLDIDVKTDMLLSFRPEDSVTMATAYLVFQSINSVMSERYYKNEDNSNQLSFTNLPKGYQARLIIYTVKNEEIYASNSEVIFGNKKMINVDMKPVSNEELKSMLTRYN